MDPRRRFELRDLIQSAPYLTCSRTALRISFGPSTTCTPSGTFSSHEYPSSGYIPVAEYAPGGRSRRTRVSRISMAGKKLRALGCDQVAGLAVPRESSRILRSTVAKGLAPLLCPTTG